MIDGGMRVVSLAGTENGGSEMVDPEDTFRLLAIETSCDETSVAVMDERGRVLAHETASQVAVHRPHGGVVPELASRNHTALLPRVMERALQSAGCEAAEMAAFAATAGPGLATSLLVGHTTAKALAVATGRPFHAVNHLEGHLLSPFLGEEKAGPAVVLVVSGGHTLLVHLVKPGSQHLLGRSRDDAAGEAFDKVGKLLGLPYPGGPEVEKRAREGNPAAFDFPRGLGAEEGMDFSFSGLKTAVRYQLEAMDEATRERRLADLCASFQEAVVDVLVGKSLKAVHATGAPVLAVGGGVACNGRLRSALAEACEADGVGLCLVAPDLATDNAAMIAEVARRRLLAGHPGDPVAGDIDPNLPLAGAGRGRAGGAR